MFDKETDVSLDGCGGISFSNRLKKADIHDAYLKWFDDARPLTKDRCSNPRTFGRKLVKLLSGGDEKILHCNNHGYLINMELARDYFNQGYSVE